MGEIQNERVPAKSLSEYSVSYQIGVHCITNGKCSKIRDKRSVTNTITSNLIYTFALSNESNFCIEVREFRHLYLKFKSKKQI